MRTYIYNALGIGIAIMVGLIVFFGVIKTSRRHGVFFANNNVKWIVSIIIWAMTTPLLYWWGSPSHISLSDAYFLRTTAPGWTFILMGYAAALGMLLGICVSFFNCRRQS